MNSRERVLAAVNHQEPDRVPLTIDMQSEVQTALCAHFGIETRVELWDKLNIDTWLVGASIKDPNPDEVIPEDESKNPWGYRTKSVSYGKGSYNEMVYHPLAGEGFSIEKIDNAILPDPEAVTFDSINKAREDHPERAIIAHISHGGFFNATFQRGLQDFLMDMFINKAEAARLIERISEFNLKALDRMIAEAGDSFDIYYMADDYCDASRPLFPPDLFREMCKPYLTAAAEKLHAAGKKFLLHVCGSVREILPDIIEAGVDMLEPIQTSAVGMEVEGLKADFGDDICFYGSLDLVSVLNRMNPDEVREVTRKNIEVLGKGGGLVFGPGHTYIQLDASVENILAMYDEAYKAR